MSASSHAQQLAASITDLSRLSIDELANLPVTGVTRTPQPASQAPASVFIITNDDIRRSGATTLAEALRLAPNLQVARSDASTYGIAARGFNHNSATSNKLQVMIDGRILKSGGKLIGIDVARIVREANDTAKRVRAEAERISKT